jgi:hypothetical protein
VGLYGNNCLGDESQGKSHPLKYYRAGVNLLLGPVQSPYCYTIPWGKVSRYSRHVDSTCVEYLLFQKIHINNKQNKYSHTREINRIIIPWIHPRDNYPFQLDYYFHGRGKLSKR